jgi:hypothetical protein
LTASGLVEIHKIKEGIMEEKNKLLFFIFFFFPLLLPSAAAAAAAGCWRLAAGGWVGYI